MPDAGECSAAGVAEPANGILQPSSAPDTLREVSRPVPAAPDAAWNGVERRSGFDRRGWRVYRFIDRRSGFDRRKRYPITGVLRDYPAVLLVLLLTMNLLSILDGIFTLAEIERGLAMEGNPVLVLAHYFGGPFGPVLIKLGGVWTASLIIWFARWRRIILLAAIWALCFYAFIVGYHIFNLRAYL